MNVKIQGDSKLTDHSLQHLFEGTETGTLFNDTTHFRHYLTLCDKRG